MTFPPFKVEFLQSHHDRSQFSCGVLPLDNYFREQVTQDVRRKVTNCFVLIENATNQVAGYYTLAASSIPLTMLPESITKRLPRYPSIPSVRIGRLAVDQAFRGKKLGSALLADAALRVAQSGVAAYALVVDAKDETAVMFYKHHGFICFNEEPMTLFVPLASILSK